MLDIVMKRSNGIDVCQALRKQGVTLPIVAVTGALSCIAGPVVIVKDLE